jgi:hypothetical protein
MAPCCWSRRGVRRRVIDVRAVAVRILGRLSSFQPREEGPPGLEDVIGVYACSADGTNIWVTAAGVMLQVQGGGHTFIRYDQVQAVHAPSTKDHTDPASGDVTLDLKDGTTCVLQVRGGHHKFVDSFEFSRFLSRVVGLLSE